MALAIVPTILLLLFALFISKQPQQFSVWLDNPNETTDPYLNIKLTFDPKPSPELVEKSIRMNPEFGFTLAWDGPQLMIHSNEPIRYGTKIQLILSPLFDPSQNMEVKESIEWTYIIRQPRILAISSDSHEILLISGASEQKILYAGDTITELSASYDGQWISWLETTDQNQSNLMLMLMDNESITSLNLSEDSIYEGIAMSPKSESLVYSIFSPESNYSEIHLLQPSTSEDAKIMVVEGRVDGSFIWSNDGSKLAFYAVETQSVFVYDIPSQTSKGYPKDEVTLGTWAENGMMIYLRHTHLDTTQTYSHICSLNLFTGEYQPIENPNLMDGQYSPPNRIPDENGFVFARQSVSGENTKQLWLINLENLEVTQITDQPSYTHARYSFDSSGQYLVFQRLDLSHSDTKPEVWRLDRYTDKFELMAQGAGLPIWLP